MPAGVYSFAEFNGVAPGTPTDRTGTTVQFKQADNSTVDNSDPIIRSPSVTVFSWRKSFKLRTTTSPDNEMRNLRFYSEGQELGSANGRREMLFASDAVFTQGSVADETGAISVIDVDTHTTGSPFVVNPVQVIANPNTGDGTQDFVVLQVSVSTAAQAGNEANAKGLVYRFDEN